VKTLGFAPRGEANYDAAAVFAAHIYDTKLELTIAHTPDYFVTLTDETDAVIGCIGLNNGVHHSLFTRDPPILALLNARRATGRRIVEQRVLANKARDALPLLLASIILVAHRLGANELCFAGIDVSIRTLQNSGFVFDQLGSANRDALMDEERADYARWFSLFTPIICVVSTAQAEAIFPLLLEHVKDQIIVEPCFAEFLQLPKEYCKNTNSSTIR
jgi:hypothetical protein